MIIFFLKIFVINSKKDEDDEVYNTLQVVTPYLVLVSWTDRSHAIRRHLFTFHPFTLFCVVFRTKLQNNLNQLLRNINLCLIKNVISVIVSTLC